MFFGGWIFCYELGLHLRQSPCSFAWNLTAPLLRSRVHHVCAFDLFQPYDCNVNHSLLVNTKKIDYFHIEGRNIWDVDCCIKTLASRSFYACSPQRQNNIFTFNFFPSSVKIRIYLFFCDYLYLEGPPTQPRLTGNLSDPCADIYYV